MRYIKCPVCENPTAEAKKKAETTSKILLSRTLSDRPTRLKNNSKLPKPKVKIFLIRFIYTKCQKLLGDLEDGEIRGSTSASARVPDPVPGAGRQTGVQWPTDKHATILE